MRNTLFALAALPILLWNCGGTQQQSVSGTIANGEGKTVNLLGYNAQGRPDTLGSAALTASGDFTIPIQTGRLAFYTLSVGTSGAFVLAFDSTQSPIVNADMNTAHKTYEVSGSKDSEAIRNLFVKSMDYETKLDSSMKVLQNLTSGDQAVRNTASANYNKLREEYRSYLLNTIDEDSTSLANFSVLQRLDPKKDVAYYIKVRNGLEAKMAGNIFYDQLANNVAQLEKTQKAEAAFKPGAMAPEISLPTPDGEIVNLSSLRGKYVLIDFWASWCKPCRMENPNVVKMYNKYADDNFEIYGVSLDRDKAKWEAAIAKDQLEWIHVSDLKFWQSAAAQLYNVKGIPFTMLIDPDGKIIQSKLRGRALEDKLAEIFGH